MLNEKLCLWLSLTVQLNRQTTEVNCPLLNRSLRFTMHKAVSSRRFHLWRFQSGNSSNMLKSVLVHAQPLLPANTRTHTSPAHIHTLTQTRRKTHIYSAFVQLRTSKKPIKLHTYGHRIWMNHCQNHWTDGILEACVHTTPTLLGYCLIFLSSN